MKEFSVPANHTPSPSCLISEGLLDSFSRLRDYPISESRQGQQNFPLSPVRRRIHATGITSLRRTYWPLVRVRFFRPPRLSVVSVGVPISKSPSAPFLDFLVRIELRRILHFPFFSVAVSFSYDRLRALRPVLDRTFILFREASSVSVRQLPPPLLSQIGLSVIGHPYLYFSPFA